jgi:Peptidase family M28
MENRSASFLILLFLLVAAAGCVLLDRPPSPVAATAPADSFSAERALVHLNNFATAPHPIGSPEHDRVRDYLAAQFTNLSLRPEIQRTTGVTPLFEAAGTIENIVARLKGTGGSSDAVMLAAHYDSVVAGPGAGDDGAGVAALLETLRALRASPPLRNDVIFLFTDGEEDGLLGASAFVAQHPWAKNARVVLNFEGRGNAGPSQMFETSTGNGQLIGVFARSVPHPNASSLSYEIYKHMPNDTDMTLFKKAGMAGLNFAFIGHWEAYHTPLDNPQLLDRGSLQHHGENALFLARSLGNADLAQLQDRDAVYFSLPGNLFFHYSARRLWPFAITSGVFLLAVVFYANGAWQTSLLKIFLGFFVQVGLLVLLLLLGFGFQYAVRWLHLRYLPEGDLKQNPFYVFGLLALIAALQMALCKLLRKKISLPAFFLGGALLIFALVLVTSKWLPGGSYLFVLPLISGLLAAVTVAFRPGRVSLLNLTILCLLSLPALLLFAPLLKAFYEALGFSSIGAPLLSVTFALLLVLLLPLLEPLFKGDSKLLPLASVFAALGLCVAGAQTARYGAAHPKPSVMEYALDADTGKALWASSADRIDAWTLHYLGASPVTGKLSGFIPGWLPFEFLEHEAPAVALLPAQAKLLENSVAGDGRTLHLRITSPRHARAVHVTLLQGEVLEASVNAQPLGRPSDSRWNRTGIWHFDYYNLPAEGIDVLLRVQGAGTVKLIVADSSIGLPAIPGVSLLPRPADSMPQHSGDDTRVKRTFVF